MLELDVNNAADLEALTESLRDRWGGVDGALHAIAFAPEDALGWAVHDDSGRERQRSVPDERVLVQGARGVRWSR